VKKLMQISIIVEQCWSFSRLIKTSMDANLTHDVGQYQTWIGRVVLGNLLFVPEFGYSALAWRVSISALMADRYMSEIKLLIFILH
jgi:hypothetical protein